MNAVAVADLYMRIFDATQKNSDTPHGRDGFYFAEHGELSMYEFGKAIGEALVAAGKIPDPKPTSFSEQEIKAMPIVRVFYIDTLMLNVRDIHRCDR